MKTNTIRITKEVLMSTIFVMLLVSMLATGVAFASSEGSSGGSSSDSGSSDSDNYNHDLFVGANNAVNNDISWTGKTFSGGNTSDTFGSNCAGCESETKFYSNGDGTYNTITTFSEGSGSGSSESGGNTNVGVSPTPTPTGSGCSGKGGCPSGGGGYSPPAPTGHYEEQCSTTGSGKGARKSCKQVWVANPVVQQQARPSAPQVYVAPIVDITATPSIVRLGGSSRISWDGGQADKCTVTGPGLSVTTTAPSSVVESTPTTPSPSTSAGSSCVTPLGNKTVADGASASYYPYFVAKQTNYSAGTVVLPTMRCSNGAWLECIINNCHATQYGQAAPTVSSVPVPAQQQTAVVISSAIKGSQVVSNIQEQSIYTLNCSKGTASAQDTARVDILPLWREY